MTLRASRCATFPLWRRAESPKSKRRSKIHPSYKGRYRVLNWSEYDRTLVQRGDLTIWFTPEVIAAWQPCGDGRRGGQRRYSDVAVEAASTLRLLFGLPWRQTEGLLGSLFALLGLGLKAPDHTTLSRRAAGLRVELRRLPTNEPVHLVVDATGLGVVDDQVQWAAAKWGARGRRGWKKLHLAVDETGRVLAADLTDRAVPDAAALPGLLDAVVSGDPVLADRDAHIEEIAEVGRRRWRVAAGQHAQARAENGVFRFKQVFGGRLRARGDAAQRNEVFIACNMLNRMTELGMPRSERVATA